MTSLFSGLPSNISSKASTLKIDAHHHLWRFNERDFGWIDQTMEAVRRDFLIDELCEELQAAKIDATVAVQARESLEETWWLLECARSAPVIRGVVGWVPLAADDLAATLDRFDGADRLVGFREIVQGRPDGYLEQPEFNRGVRQLTDRGLTYDILIYESQLSEAIKFIDQHPNQRFVLDHAAKPKIVRGELEPWRTNMRVLSSRANVTCKISGLVTEAAWSHWTLESLRPYLDNCVESFGADRLIAGSDWPVCLLATNYSRWWDVLRHYFADFSGEEVDRIFGGNAMSFYGLGDKPKI
jgi:L-fuconolactonase